MKKLSKILAIIIAALMVCLFASCADDNSSNVQRGDGGKPSGFEGELITENPSAKKKTNKTSKPDKNEPTFNLGLGEGETIEMPLVPLN